MNTNWNYIYNSLICQNPRKRNGSTVIKTTNTIDSIRSVGENLQKFRELGAVDDVILRLICSDEDKRIPEILENKNACVHHSRKIKKIKKKN